MDKWDALKEILRLDAEAFAEQGKSFEVQSKIVLDETERNNLIAGANILAFQVAAALHYANIMEQLDEQERLAMESLAADDGGAEPNKVEALN